MATTLEPERPSTPPASARVSPRPTSAAQHWTDRHPTAVPWLYLGAIAVAEIETGLFDIRWGLLLHSLILLALPVHAVVARDKPYHRLLICLVVAPLIRVMSLTLPLIGFPTEYWYLIVSIPVFTSTFMIAQMLGYTRNDLGLVWRNSRAQIIIACTGPFLGWTEGHILTVQSLAAVPTFAAMAPPILILVVSTGFMEEVVFRGLLQRAAYGLFFDDGILYVSLLFAVLHTGYRSWEDSIFVFCVGLLYSIAVRRSGAIFGTTASHGSSNVVLYVIMPLFFPRT